MPKLKDFFTKLKEQGKITLEDFDKFIPTLPEGEIPDVIVNSIEENFLTLERAKAEPRIEKHFRAQTLNGVDSWITELTTVDQNLAHDFGGEVDTFKKLKMVKSRYKDTLDKAKNAVPPGNMEEKDKKITDLQASVSNLTSKIDELNLTHSKTVKEKEIEFNSKLSTLELDYAIKEQIATYTLSDEYNDSARKRRAMQFILAEAKEGQFLSLKDGEILVWSDQTMTNPKFNGNSSVKFKELLDKAAEPYLKKNTISGEGNGKERRESHQQNPPLTGKETLQQIRARQVQTS